jgi:hypothetical protein
VDTTRHSELPGKRSGVFGGTTLTSGVRFLHPARWPTPTTATSNYVAKAGEKL